MCTPGLQSVAQLTGTFFTTEPFSIQVSSRHSKGAALFRMEATAFLNEVNIPFHQDIPLPRFGTQTFSLPAMAYEAYLPSSFLHMDFARVDRSEMLKMIISETRKGRDVLEEWGAAFAELHGLDYPNLLAKARKRGAGRRLSSLRAMLGNLLWRYRVDKSHDLAVRDVFEASLIASTHFVTRHRLVQNYPRTLARVAGKLFRVLREEGAA